MVGVGTNTFILRQSLILLDKFRTKKLLHQTKLRTLRALRVLNSKDSG